MYTYLYISQPRYLPMENWLNRIDKSNILILLDDHLYSYTSYINRRYIQEKQHWLTIPIHNRKRNVNSVINTLQICDNYYTRYKQKHVCFLQQNKILYHKEYIHAIDNINTKYLFTFLYIHLVNLFELLNIHTQIVLASSLNIDYTLYKKTELLLQISKCFNNSVLNISKNMFLKYFEPTLFTHNFNILD